MNAYLFNASVTCSQALPDGRGLKQTSDGIRTWDACVSQIVCASNPAEAQKWFEDWLGTQPEGQPLIQSRINKIVAAEFMDQMLTETECVSINWLVIAEEASPATDSTPADGLEPGFWVDVNEAVRAQGLSSDIESLRHSLPEDIRSGLNWLAGKNFIFLLSVLSPPPPQTQPEYEAEHDMSPDDGVPEEYPDTPDMIGLAEEHMAYPELVDKEAAVVIQARNSIVAAWLWRKYSTNTPLAGHAIRIDPWYGVLLPANLGEP